MNIPRAGADLDLTARGWLYYMPPSVRTYMPIDKVKVTRVKSLKQNNMLIFVISSQFIYYNYRHLANLEQSLSQWTKCK